MISKSTVEIKITQGIRMTYDADFKENEEKLPETLPSPKYPLSVNPYFTYVHIDDPRFNISKDEFTKMWELAPKEYKKLGHGKKCSIRQQSYLKTYKYSGGVNVKAEKVPDIFMKLLGHVNTSYCKHYNQSSKEYTFNSILVNWYKSNESLGEHSDNTDDLVKDSSIFILSYGSERRFQISSNYKDTTTKTKALRKTYKVKHGDAIVMGGSFQEYFKHKIMPLSKEEKKNKSWPGRISITFRVHKSSDQQG